MQTSFKRIIYYCLFLCNLLSIQSALAYNTVTSPEDAAEALNYIVENPYSYPQYLFEQVYVVKAYAERTSAKRFDIAQIILSESEKIKSRGWKVPQKHLSSILAFIDKNNLHFEVNALSVENLDTIDLCIENISCIDVYRFPFNYHDVHEVVDEIQQCKEIAHFLIDDVPPRVTLGFTLITCGHLLTFTPQCAWGNLIKGIGVSFLCEACNDTREKQQQEKKNGPVDIRQPLSKKHPADIRQRHIR